MWKHYNVHKVRVKRQILTFYSSGFFSECKQRVPNGFQKQLAEIPSHTAHDFLVKAMATVNGKWDCRKHCMRS